MFFWKSQLEQQRADTVHFKNSKQPLPVPAWHCHCLPLASQCQGWQRVARRERERTLRVSLDTEEWQSHKLGGRVLLSSLPPWQTELKFILDHQRKEQWSSNGNLTSLLSIWKYFLKLIEKCSNVKFHLLGTFFRKDFQHFAFNDHFTELLKIQIQF